MNRILNRLGNLLLLCLGVLCLIELIGKILFVFILIPRFQYDAVVWCEPLIWVAMTIQLLYAFVNNSYVKETRKAMKAAAA